MGIGILAIIIYSVFLIIIATKIKIPVYKDRRKRDRRIKNRRKRIFNIEV